MLCMQVFSFPEVKLSEDELTLIFVGEYVVYPMHNINKPCSLVSESNAGLTSLQVYSYIVICLLFHTMSLAAMIISG